MKKIVFAILCTLSIVAVRAQTNSQTDTTIFSKFPEEKNLSFDPVFTPKTGYIRRLYLQDSTIVTWSVIGRGDFFFQQYSLTGQRLSDGFIRAGRDFGEVAGALSGGFHRNTFWLHDVSLKKLVTASPAKSPAGRDTVLLNEYSLSQFYFSLDLLDSLKILGCGIYDSPYKIEEADLQNDTMIRGYGAYAAAPAGIPFNSWKGAYESFLFTRPGADKAVLACRYTDQVEILDRATNKSRLIKGPENFEVAFNPFHAGGRDIMMRTEDTRFAFVNGMTTKKFIYLLYSGNHEVEGAGNKNSNGKCIYVYDWEGKPVKKMTTDRYITSFVVAGDDSIIYASDSETGAIVKAKIGL